VPEVAALVDGVELDEPPQASANSSMAGMLRDMNIFFMFLFYMTQTPKI
jgi:hypothetical protein